jgi:hypothetical protein
MTALSHQKIGVSLSDYRTMSREENEEISVPNPMSLLSLFPPVTNPLAAQTSTLSVQEVKTGQGTALINAAAEAPMAFPMVPQNMPIMPFTANNKLPTNNPTPNSIPEFLYQLTKMLTDDNSQYIEWANGRIEVYDPHKVEDEILRRYFRHSKFASFQRQLNYFGFRKLSGKGKMEPCSYVNDATTDDLQSLLQIKRKTTPAPSRGKKRERSANETPSPSFDGAGISIANPFFGDKQVNGKAEPNSKRPNCVNLSTPSVSNSTTSTQLVDETNIGGATNALSSASLGVPNFSLPQGCLSDNATNGNTSMQSLVVGSMEVPNPVVPKVGGVPVSLGMLSKNSSLVDLAMICSSEPTPINEVSSSSLDMPVADWDWQKILV